MEMTNLHKERTGDLENLQQAQNMFVAEERAR